MNSKNEKKILIPRSLSHGDTIGIAAPAGAFEKEKFYQGIAVLEGMGFQVFVPDYLFEKKGYLAGDDAHRANLLNRLFADNQIKAILCARGGFGSLRILSLLDFEIIRNNPKIFVGFSDITAILSVLYEKCGLVTFHGPVLTTLGTGDQKTKDALFSALSSGIKSDIRPEKGVIIQEGIASGILSGGNLATLCHLLGTQFQSDLRGHILLLEDISEPAYKIDRMLTQMKIAGCFDQVAGVVLGSFEDCGDMNDIFRIVKNIFRSCQIPVLAGFDIGHGKCNITLPLGIEAILDTYKMVLISGDYETG